MKTPEHIHYIDISRKAWLPELPLEEGYRPYEDSEGKIQERLNVMVIFTDGALASDDIPDYIWDMTGKGIYTVIVLLDEFQSNDWCWPLLKSGISDIIIWEGVDALSRILKSRLEREIEINDILQSPLVKNHLVGSSRVWCSFLRDVCAVAMYSGSNVLITGESGTGKELVSRLIHTLDSREEKGKLILVDCTTIVPELAGSEFFGHEKGSYTSSVSSRDGAFALAHNGTLFLDEIGELPLNLQAELLRAIQEKTYKRVGSNEWRKTDFRLICATHRDLKALVAEGRFREDLYYRITDVVLRVPSLEEHAADIPELANHFLRQFLVENQIDSKVVFDSTVMNFIRQRDYRGNIRELRQLVRRIAMGHREGRYITLGNIPLADIPDSESTAGLMATMENWENSIKQAILSGESLMGIKNIAAYLAIKIAIDMEEGDKQRAAERLDVTVRAVQQYAKKHRINKRSAMGL